MTPVLDIRSLPMQDADLQMALGNAVSLSGGVALPTKWSRKASNLQLWVHILWNETSNEHETAFDCRQNAGIREYVAVH